MLKNFTDAGLSMAKLKVKLSLSLAKHYKMKTYWGVDV